MDWGDARGYGGHGLGMAPGGLTGEMGADGLL